MGARSLARRTRSALTRAEWRRVGLLAAAIAGLHLVGFGLLLGVVAPAHHRLGAGGVFGLGVGLTAYTLGLRHAFDADHIGAIDNTTRALVQEGQRPLTMGFFFSLGHSTVVFVLGLLVAAGVRGLSGAVADEHSALHRVAGLVGPVVSGSFLVLIGILNLVVLASIIGVLRRMRRGGVSEPDLEAQLQAPGAMGRWFGRATRAVRRPWHMYPLGCLFGLGFDTATEVALLVLAGGAAAGHLPFYAILCLPVLFAAGMVLFDTIDGACMTVAYGWALDRPVRKVFFNLTVTGLSVAVALLIGTLELVSVLAAHLGLHGGVWDVAAGLDLNVVGYGVVVLFALTWLGALAVWRLGRVEERWTARIADPG